MIDTLDYGSINEWKSSTVLVSGIVRYEKKEFLMWGETEPRNSRKLPNRYFTFNLESGFADKFETKEDLLKALEHHGVKTLKLKSIKENWGEYWKNPRTKDQSSK